MFRKFLKVFQMILVSYFKMSEVPFGIVSLCDEFEFNGKKALERLLKWKKKLKFDRAQGKIRNDEILKIKISKWWWKVGIFYGFIKKYLFIIQTCFDVRSYASYLFRHRAFPSHINSHKRTITCFFARHLRLPAADEL